ncbi:hypothetical protein HAX54_016577 [Datura stramonium]|uniref:Uncharacterized protein n=1 Tax=Datura stramonium TaxID=4076 RepID=A0ABS8UJ21_DATST|nr:hypothetical protein [Datura stramonium]
MEHIIHAQHNPNIGELMSAIVPSLLLVCFKGTILGSKKNMWLTKWITRLLLHESESSLIRPLGLAPVSMGSAAGFMDWATSLRLFLMLDFSNGSCFLSLRICLFVA